MSGKSWLRVKIPEKKFDSIRISRLDRLNNYAHQEHYYDTIIIQTHNSLFKHIKTIQNTTYLIPNIFNQHVFIEKILIYRK